VDLLEHVTQYVQYHAENQETAWAADTKQGALELQYHSPRTLRVAGHLAFFAPDTQQVNVQGILAVYEQALPAVL
jgi:hypothetical protein